MYGGEGNAGFAQPRRDVLLPALALVALVVLVLAPSAAAAVSASRLTPSSPVTRGSGYVALGDSVTFGYQEPAVSPAPDYQRAASFRGYPEQLGTELHLKVANFACPGETTASLINVKAPTLACENAYRLVYPLHVRYRGSQLGAAVAYLHSHPGVRLVSLMIGANDLLRCQAVTRDACASPAELRTTLAEITGNIHRILSTLRDHAHYSGQIVVVNYYSLSYASALVTSQTQALNRTQDVAAKPFHVRFADGYGEFRTASLRFGSQPCLAGLITQVGSYGKCGIHPSYAGQALLAKAVASATRL